MGDVPLVVCVSTDATVRQRVATRLDDCGAVVMCTDLEDLRRLFFSPAPATPAPAAPAAPGAAAGTPGAAGTQGALTGVIRVGDLLLDRAEHTVTWQGDPVPLTRIERELLRDLAVAHRSVRTYDQLFRSVWGDAYLRETSTLHSAVKRLRRKLRAVTNAATIQTVRGVGYRLVVGPGAAV